MTTDANELSLNELNHLWVANLIRIPWPDSDLRSVPRQFRERTQDSIRTDGRRHTFTQDVGSSGPAGMAILEINRSDVRALGIFTEVRDARDRNSEHEPLGGHREQDVVEIN